MKKNSAPLGWILVGLLIGSYNLILFYNASLGIYIHPRFFLLSGLTSIILVVFFGLALAAWFKSNKNLKIKLSIDILPIILFTLAIVILPPTYLSPSAASNRAAGSSNTPLEVKQPDLASLWLTGTSNYTVSDWAKIFNSTPDLTKYAGAKVNLTGFIFVGTQPESDKFFVSRYVVRCCVVDATPVGLQVVMPQWRDSLLEQDWVSIQGVFELVSVNGSNYLQIVPTEVKKIDPPKAQYEY